MCMTIKKSWFRKTFKMKPKLLTAKEDIVYYKVYITLEDGVKSKYQKTIHEFGRQSHIKIGVTSFEKKWQIDEGYHSFVNEEDAIAEINSNNESVYKCIIPKDTCYVIGKWAGSNIDNYVSNEIIIEPNQLNLNK